MNVGLMFEFRTWFRPSGRDPTIATGSGRHHMDHAEVMVAQIAQKSGQHGGGSRFGVMEQDDSLAGGVEPIGDQL